MTNIDIKKAYALLISTLETFLTYEIKGDFSQDILPNEDSMYVLSLLYEYIDDVNIKECKNTNHEIIFRVKTSLINEDIIITIRHSNNIPYSMQIKKFTKDWKYSVDSELKENKAKIDSKIKKFYEKRLEENLSYDNLVNKLFYTGNNNAHLKKFYNLKKQFNGKDVSNIKVVTANVSDEGYCDVLFSVKATKDGKKKKELVGNNGELTDNISDEYQIILRINDFWDLIDEFGLENKNDFTKNDVVALIQLSQDIKISDTTPSFWWMGTSYYLTQDNASLMPCNIAPKFWNRDDLRPNVKVSKSMEGVLKNLGFFAQQIAMSIKKNLVDQGYILPYKK